jgi:hypothetical protein
MNISTARELAKLRGRADKLAARTDDPTKEELQLAIDNGFCWWCGATHGVEGKPIRAWAIHWSKAHGILARHVRDILEVSGAVVFCDEEMREANRKARQNPAHLAHLERVRAAMKGKPRKPPRLTKGSRKAQAEATRKRMSTPEAKEQLARMSRETGRKRRKYRDCDVCGKRYWCSTKGDSSALTCSPECKTEKQNRTVKMVSDKDIRRIRKMAGAGLTNSRKLADLFGLTGRISNADRYVRYVLAGDIRQKVRGEELWPAKEGDE